MARPEAPRHLAKRSLCLNGHRTSIALEPAFWAVLEAAAAARGISLSALVAEVDAGRAPGVPLASALRVFALAAPPRPAAGERGRGLPAGGPAAGAEEGPAGLRRDRPR